MCDYSSVYSDGVSTGSDPPFNGTLCNDGRDDGGSGDWHWGADGANFSLGNRFKMHFPGNVILDGVSSRLPDGFSAATERGDFTISIGSFESRAVYSMKLFVSDLESLGVFPARGSKGENETTTRVIVNRLRVCKGKILNL